jgi:TRAP-type C4-dicarboxylate transport system permease small subunit
MVLMLKRLAQFEFAIAVALLASIVVLVFVAAVMRSFGRPLIWSVDMAQLLFIWLCMFGATRAMRQKGHLGIDLIVRFLPHTVRLWVEFVISALILGFLALLAVEGTKLTILNQQRQFGDSGLSYGWVTAAVPVGCAMLAIALLFNMVTAWRRRRDGETLVYSRSESESAASAAPSEL